MKQVTCTNESTLNRHGIPPLHSVCGSQYKRSPESPILNLGSAWVSYCIVAAVQLGETYA